MQTVYEWDALVVNEMQRHDDRTKLSSSSASSKDLCARFPPSVPGGLRREEKEGEEEGEEEA